MNKQKQKGKNSNWEFTAKNGKLLCGTKFFRRARNKSPETLPGGSRLSFSGLGLISGSGRSRPKPKAGWDKASLLSGLGSLTILVLFFRGAFGAPSPSTGIWGDERATEFGTNGPLGGTIGRSERGCCLTLLGNSLWMCIGEFSGPSKIWIRSVEGLGFDSGSACGLSTALSLDCSSSTLGGAAGIKCLWAILSFCRARSLALFFHEKKE